MNNDRELEIIPEESSCELNYRLQASFLRVQYTMSASGFPVDTY
jgi:hypothetical protein